MFVGKIKSSWECSQVCKMWERPGEKYTLKI